MNLSGGSRLSACPREIMTVEVKLLAHSFLSLTINSLFASGSRLCYLFVIAFFVRSYPSYLLIVMSSPSKRPPAAATSPSDAESTAITPVKLLAAPTTMLASFVRLLGFPGAEAEAEIKCMFSEWGVHTWLDMACFAAGDMEKFIDVSESAALHPQRLWKQLGFIMEYTRLGHDLDPTMSIRSVICAVDEYRTTPHKSNPRQPTSPPWAGLHQEKKTVPDLKEFTGKDKDYFSWQDSAVNDLGNVGLIHFTTDPPMITKQPELAISVFYALQATLQNGTASNFATALYYDNKCNPLELWQNIEQWYDTLVNCANVVLFEVKKLLSLHLDPDIVPTKFITDFNKCFLWLKKNKAGLALDTDTLWALLLVAIQDKQFKPVRDMIVKEPTRGVDEILKDLRD